MSNLLKILSVLLFYSCTGLCTRQSGATTSVCKTYTLFSLYFVAPPFSINRSWQMIIAFVFGMCMDYFTGTPGLHAIPCVLIAYLRPFLLNILMPQEKPK